MAAQSKPGYRLASGSDVDLATEDVRDHQGRRITQKYVDQAVDDVHTRMGRGRPSLAGAGSSPQVTFRLPLELRLAAERQALAEGTRVSTVARKALEEYLARSSRAS